MTRRLTDELVADLARDLEPVRPVARLRVVSAAALALWGVAVVLAWFLDGHAPEPEAWPWQHFVGLAGLGVAGLGGIVASLANAVPGREPTAKVGLYAMGLGVSAALAAGMSGAWGAGSGSYQGSLGCVVRSIAIGSAPLLIAGLFVMRGAVSQFRGAACLVLVGSAGLGALAVQATCPTLTGGHVLVGHCVGPLVLAALASLPLAAVWGRSSSLHATKS